MSQTQLTIDYHAVSHARYWYENWCGIVRRVKPKKPTFNGQVLTEEGKALLLKLGKPQDEWTPHCRLQLRNNHSLFFKGDAAKKQWKAYNNTIYGKQSNH